MDALTFVNYYEILEVSPSASAEAIEHSFRHLARRYHPDNQATGDRSRFDLVVTAHKVLKDPGKRAQYHLEHKNYLPPFWLSEDDTLANEANGQAVHGEGVFIDGSGIDRDLSIQNNILILLYLRRRQNIREPGIGDAELERLTGCPPEHLEFHIWYLKAKSWIATGEDGLLSITIDGVDRAALLYRDGAAKLITDQGRPTPS
ncbi:MAG TPA: J domain-containing protein [Caulobacteraceae bacterium]